MNKNIKKAILPFTALLLLHPVLQYFIKGADNFSLHEELLRFGGIAVVTISFISVFIAFGVLFVTVMQYFDEIDDTGKVLPLAQKTLWLSTCFFFGVMTGEAIMR